MPRRRNRSGNDDSRRTFLKASGAGAVVLALAGCSGKEEDPKNSEETETTTSSKPQEFDIGPDVIKPGGTFTYGLPDTIKTSNYLMASDVYTAIPLAPIYNFGIEQDPITYEVKPSVFTDWEIKNADKEKPDVYFTADTSGLIFSDGEPLKKEDILFSYQHSLDNEPAELVDIWDNVESIEEAKNDFDFHVKLKKKVGTWDTAILGAQPIIPKHIWSKVKYDKYEPHKNGGPIGTGPGELTKFSGDTSAQITFRRDYIDNEYRLNKLQWKKDHKTIIHGGPFLDKINFKVFGGEPKMHQEMLRGGVDTMYGSMPVEKIPKANKNGNIKLVRGFDSGFSYWGFNMRREPLDDVAFRQAMAMAYDDRYWIESLNGNMLQKGDYPQSPGFAATRPEKVFGGELLKAPETNAFDFRRTEPGSDKPDVEGIQKFLTDGKVISEKGTYVGKEFPGTFSGETASLNSAKHEYSVGPVKSEVLKNTDYTVDKEIRVNGQTIPELMGGPLTLLMDPPSEKPKEAKAINRYVRNLRMVGIPVKTEPVGFETMVARVYKQEDFDVYPMGWGGTSPYGTSSYWFFHSSQADKDGSEEKTKNNAMGYGHFGGSADDLIMNAYGETDPKKRNKKWATAFERIYLDMAYMVRDYEKYRWPVNSKKFGGFVGKITDPAYANWDTEYENIYLKKNLQK